MQQWANGQLTGQVHGKVPTSLLASEPDGAVPGAVVTRTRQPSGSKQFELALKEATEIQAAHS